MFYSSRNLLIFLIPTIFFAILIISACTEVEPNPEEALKSGDYYTAHSSFKEKAKKGDANAQYHLGQMYLKGLGVNNNDMVAFKHFKNAAVKDHPQAQYQLALLYESGRGTAVDQNEAYNWYLKSAEQGNAKAQHKLGIINDRELGKARNVKEAKKWYKKAAQQGDASALHDLMTIDRRGVLSSDDDVPNLAVARASGSVITDVDQLDQAAHEAQLNFMEGLGNSDESLNRSLWTAYRVAEDTLTSARDQAWDAFPFTETRPVIVSDPLNFAMLDLQIELRRYGGPSKHTLVPVLVDDPGCAGDIISDRLVYRYGYTVNNPLLISFMDSQADTDILDQFARQIACLSVRQLALVEEGITIGFVATSERLKEHGMESLIPAFARIVAPLQLMLLDARKHRGERSFSWQWFRSFKPVLKPAVSGAGWVSGPVYLWNRHQARLVGYPPCPPGQITPQCLDLERFFESITDPRAMGLGGCALAGMVDGGLKPFGDQDLYNCPTMPCGAEEDNQSDQEMRESLVQQASVAWPSYDANEIIPELPGGTNPLCRHMDDTTLQGGAPEDACADEIFNQAPNPWDTYAVCMTEAVGGGDEPEVFQSYSGVAMGEGCGLFTEGGGDDQSGWSEFWDSVADFFTGLFDDDAGADGSDAAASQAPSDVQSLNCDTSNNTCDAKLKSGGTVRFKVNDDGSISIIHYLNVDDSQDADEAAWLIMRLYTGQISFKHNGNKSQMSPDAAFDALDFLHRQKKGSQNCLDPVACPDACTGVGAQIAAANECTEGLLDAFREALGRPRGGPDDDEIIPKQDIVSIWDPEGAPLEVEPSPCFMGDIGPVRVSMGCGLIHCTDGIASMVGGECRCGGDTGQPLRPLKPITCYTIQCQQGDILTDDCRCEPIAQEPVTPPGDGLPTNQ